MVEAVTAFLPAKVDVPDNPVRFPVNIYKLISNNLTLIPKAAYHQSVTVVNGLPRMAFFTGEKSVKRVLHKSHEDFPKGELQNQILEPLFGDAMISCNGPEWRWQRQATAPLFRHEELLGYGPVFTRSAVQMTEVWAKESSNEPRQINRDMMHAAFGVISNTMLAGGAESVMVEIEKGHREYFNYVNWWIFNRMFRLPRSLPRPGKSKMRDHELRLTQSVMSIVEKRLRQSCNDSDLLGRLLQAKDPDTGNTMSAERIVKNVIAFLVAGYDTTALAMTWALYLIATHPNWQEEIAAEANRVAGSNDITTEHYKGLLITQQVICETLRLYPTAPVIIRDILQDVQIDGAQISKGTIGIVPIYAIHRHCAVWRNPDHFDPSRFAKDAAFKPSRFQYLPFGSGPRICIGNGFAMMEMTIMLATFVRQYAFRMPDGFTPQPKGQIFLTSGNDMPMHVNMR